MSSEDVKSHPVYQKFLRLKELFDDAERHNDDLRKLVQAQRKQIDRLKNKIIELKNEK